MSYGEELEEINEELNYYMQTRHYSGKYRDIESVSDVESEVSGKKRENALQPWIKQAAGCLSKELLYMKFLQGIPVVGAAGGIYDAVYMKKVVEYAKMKYQRRFLLKRIEHGMK